MKKRNAWWWFFAVAFSLFGVGAGGTSVGPFLFPESSNSCLWELTCIIGWLSLIGGLVGLVPWGILRRPLASKRQQ
jgi:hypothetical protein